MTAEILHLQQELVEDLDEPCVSDYGTHGTHCILDNVEGLDIRDNPLPLAQLSEQNQYHMFGHFGNVATEINTNKLGRAELTQAEAVSLILFPFDFSH